MSDDPVLCPGYAEGYDDGYEDGYGDACDRFDKTSPGEWLIAGAIVGVYIAIGFLLAHALGGLQ